MRSERSGVRPLIAMTLVAVASAIAAVAHADDAIPATDLGQILGRKGLITREELQEATQESAGRGAGESPAETSDRRADEPRQGSSDRRADEPRQGSSDRRADESRLVAIEAKLPKWLAMLTPFGDL